MRTYVPYSERVAILVRNFDETKWISKKSHQFANTQYDTRTFDFWRSIGRRFVTRNSGGDLACHQNRIERKNSDYMTDLRKARTGIGWRAHTVYWSPLLLDHWFPATVQSAGVKTFFFASAMLDQVSPAALACFGGLAVVTVLLLVFFTLPLIASIIASLFGTPLLKNSALYIGNVWHTRLHPKRHSFTVSSLSRELRFIAYAYPCIESN